MPHGLTLKDEAFRIALKYCLLHRQPVIDEV